MREIAARPLPEGLRWGVLSREEEYEGVRGRTEIPRFGETMRELCSVAVFPLATEPGLGEEGKMPVAWALVGLDGSLTSLFVEEGFRGQGLGKMVAVRVWERGMGVFEEEGMDGGEGWLVSSDVSPENEESTGVCRSLGGERGWEVYWVRVDLSRLGNGGSSE